MNENSRDKRAGAYMVYMLATSTCTRDFARAARARRGGRDSIQKIRFQRVAHYPLKRRVGIGHLSR